jgi:hypothetical protein
MAEHPDRALQVQHPRQCGGLCPQYFFFAHSVLISRLWRSRNRGILVEHDLFGKPVSTFPDHA